MDNKLFDNFKLQLGAPIRQIELTDEHFTCAFKDAEDTFLLYSNGRLLDTKSIWVEKYTFAVCKEILGRVRGKFSGVVGQPENPLIMDYKALLSEAETEKNKLINFLQNLK